MLESTRAKLLERLQPGDVVLDVGSWADPFERADWVIDLFPYETRGLYERRGWTKPRAGAGEERFSETTWIQRDVCDREPFPFADGEIDFAICSHTLEDVRDPVWVCSELQRVAKAGYIEVPSRLEEQSWGVGGGEFVGWTHHHWLIDVGEASIEFVFKTHVIHSVPEYYFPHSFWLGLREEEKVQTLWWEGSFAYRERVIFEDSLETIAYLRDFVQAEMAARGFKRPRELRSLPARARARGAALGRRLRERAGGSRLAG